jgi:hypothetical protein
MSDFTNRLDLLDRINRQPRGRHTIEARHVFAIAQAAESKWSARLERWAARKMAQRLNRMEAEAELQRFIELD